MRFSLTFILALLISGALSAQQISHKVSWQLSPGQAETQLLAHIQQHLPALPAGVSLRLKTHRSTAVADYYHFQQFYGGTPIFEKGIKCVVAKNGKVYSLLDQLFRFDQVVESRALINHEQISDQIVAKFAAEPSRMQDCYVAEGSMIRAAVHVHVQSPDASADELLIDPNSGRTLMRRADAAFFANGDTTGRGRVFRPDPLTKAGQFYGMPITDNNDAHDAVFESLMDTVILKDITYENGVFKLVGPYVSVEDIGPFPNTPSTSIDGDFFFGRDEQGFEDIMVYYHIDTFHRYVASFGYTNLRTNDSPLSVDSHGKGSSDQSSFTINGGDPYLLFGDGGVDDAEDADVIIHEYGHALSYAASPGTLSGQERRGLDEGLADYFAAIYSANINTFDAENIFNWDGHNEFWQGRIVNSNAEYPPQSTSIYAYGEIWASVMMKIRDDLGSDVTDQLQIEALYGNFIGMGLPDAAQLVIDADSMLFNGVHTETLRFYFCAQKLLPNANCLAVDLEEERPRNLWTVAPNPSQGKLQIRLEGERRHPMDIRLLDLRGRVIKQELIYGSQANWQLDVPAGLYLIQLFQNGVRLDSKKLVLQNH
ncbi:MAG: T9SS type A sorting domain-containing protein [Bacteroidota bacterium]